MRPHFSLTIAAAALALFALPGHATSTLTGTVTAPVPGATGYTGTLTVAQASSDLGSLIGNSFQILCIDRAAAFPSYGSVHSYVSSDSLTSSMMGHGANAARATDLVNWVIDQSYDSLMRSGSSGTSVNRAMWEITTDFDGTAASLDTRTGDFQLDTASYPVAVPLVDGLRYNYASIAIGYRSAKYTVSFLDDVNGGYQNMVMLSPIPTAPVPEPNTLALLSAGGLAMGFVVRRRKAR